MIEFLPSKDIRAFNVANVEGMNIVLHLKELGRKDEQWVWTHIPLYGDQYVSIAQWVSQKLGEPGSTIEKMIVKAVLLEAKNGGRFNNREYKSYQEYFDSCKDTVMEYWRGGMMLKIMRGSGDPDSMDIRVYLGNGMILEGPLYEFSAPEEWYSEIHRDNYKFQLRDGLFDTADEAIYAYSLLNSEDLFGERYFPVAVFPIETTANIRDIMAMPKGSSKPIVTRDNIIFGTRCKSSEYQELIKLVYENGGKIAKNLQWDWDG